MFKFFNQKSRNNNAEKECKKFEKSFWEEAFLQCRGYRNIYTKNSCEDGMFTSFMDHCVSVSRAKADNGSAANITEDNLSAIINAVNYKWVR